MNKQLICGAPAENNRRLYPADHAVRHCCLDGVGRETENNHAEHGGAYHVGEKKDAKPDFRAAAEPLLCRRFLVAWRQQCHSGLPEGAGHDNRHAGRT